MTHSTSFSISDNLGGTIHLNLAQAAYEARHLCADLRAIQIYGGVTVYQELTKFKTARALGESLYSPDDINALDLAVEVCTDELHRRDATYPTFAGYVYVLSTEFDAYKIGCTSKPQNRLLNFGVLLPFEVKCLCMIYSADMYRLERELHERFADQRTRGEWFKLRSEDIEYVMGLAG